MSTATLCPKHQEMTRWHRGSRAFRCPRCVGEYMKEGKALARERRREHDANLFGRMANVVRAMAAFDGNHALPAWILPEVDALAEMLNAEMLNAEALGEK